MFVKLHKSYRTVVAVCDSELIGKSFEEGLKCLDIRETFYKGEEIDFNKTVKILKFQSKEDSTFNIVGPEAIKAAIEAEIIEEDSVGKIDGIPFALVLL